MTIIINFEYEIPQTNFFMHVIHHSHTKFDIKKRYTKMIYFLVSLAFVYLVGYIVCRFIQCVFRLTFKVFK